LGTNLVQEHGQPQAQDVQENHVEDGEDNAELQHVDKALVLCEDFPVVVKANEAGALEAGPFQIRNQPAFFPLAPFRRHDTGPEPVVVIVFPEMGQEELLFVFAEQGEKLVIYGGLLH